MKILIADDSLPVRRMIRRMVARTCDEVYECADGLSALSVYQRQRPDWTLMDLKMPQMDGLAVTREICALHPSARVIVVTNYDDAMLREEARAAGAFAYFAKDDLSKLRAVLREPQTH